MKNWDIPNETGKCNAEQDYTDAKWICDKLKIPLVQINFVKYYWNHIFSEVINQYQIGLTPNPDILCNKIIKFDKFYKLAREKFHADAIATGHYARTNFGPYLENYQPNTNVHLLQARDTNKDQTFFLSQVSQEPLRYSMFPLGEYLKCDVKQIAKDAGLDVVLEKKESMGMCFVGKREFQHFISEYIDDVSGNFVDLETGAVVGKHNGIHHWTIGQRCKISGSSHAYFVFQKDVESNAIIVVKGTDHPALYTDLLISQKPHWIVNEPNEFKNSNGVLKCSFRFQHRDPLVDCDVYKTHKNYLVIRLVTPLRAITKGQYVVLYSGEECLGSSAVSFPGPSYYVLNHKIEHGDTTLRKK